VKILFIARATLYTDRGGDSIQVLRTADYLRKRNVEVDVKLTDEMIDYESYDLLHFFNIIRPADILRHIFKSGKPYVVSTIFVDYADYEKNARTGLAKVIFDFFSPDQVEYLKAVARSVKNREKIVSPEYIWWGHRRSIKYIVLHAQYLLPNSESEYERFFNRYKIHKSFRVIPNAIDPALFKTPGKLDDRNNKLLICVGRIEGRKNQLNLIKAVKNSGFELYLIGSPSANQFKYYDECKKNAGDNVHFINALDQEELIRYYSTAKVHILASWFETTGLSSLEAAAMGCNIVITTHGDTREYFEDFAWYCDPSSPASILEAIKKAIVSPCNQELIKKINTQYTWEMTAIKTEQVYEEILNRNVR
jgi:glycosyltransferase involved in cell wall biosynthesis